MSEPKKGPGILGYALSLTGVEQFKGGFKDARKEMDAAGDSAEKSGKRFDGLFSVLGKAAAIAAPVVSVMAFRKAWAGAMEDLSGMEKLKARMNPAGDAIKSIEADIARLQMTVGRSDGELMDLASSALDAGVEESNLMDILETSAKNAEGSYQDLGGMIRGTQTILAQFKDDVGSANDVQNMLWAATKSGAGAVDELASNVSNLGPIAEAVGIKVQEMVAMTAFFGKRGVGSTRALMSIGNLLTGIQDTSNKDRAAEADRLGISWSGAAVKAMGFTGWLQHVEERLNLASESGNDTTKSLAKLGLEARAMGMFSALAKGADEYAGILGQITSKQDELGRLWDTKADSIEMKSKRLEQVQAEMWDSFGNGLIQGVSGTDALNQSTDVLQGRLDNLTKAGESFGTSLGKAIEWATSENGLPKLMDLAIKTATVVGKVLGPIIDAIEFITTTNQDVEKKMYSGQSRVIPYEDANGKVQYRTETYDPNYTGGFGPDRKWRPTGTTEKGEVRTVAEADSSGRVGYRQEARDPLTGKWGAHTAPSKAVDLASGGLAAFEALSQARGPSLAELAADAAMNPEINGKALEVTVKMDQRLTVAKDGTPKGVTGTAKMAGAGDANLHAEYRMTYIREGDGIHEVKPLPMHVIGATRRPARRS